MPFSHSMNTFKAKEVNGVHGLFAICHRRSALRIYPYCRVVLPDPGKMNYRP